MLTSAVKRRELINFTILFSKVHIRVTYFYTPLLGTNAIMFNLKLAFPVAIFSKLYKNVFTV